MARVTRKEWGFSNQNNRNKEILEKTDFLDVNRRKFNIFKSTNFSTGVPNTVVKNEKISKSLLSFAFISRTKQIPFYSFFNVEFLFIIIIVVSTSFIIIIIYNFLIKRSFIDFWTSSNFFDFTPTCPNV